MIEKQSLIQRMIWVAKWKLTQGRQETDFGMFFASILNLTKAKICVEVGVFSGNTTKQLCEATEGHVYGFDNWEPHGLVNQFSHRFTKADVEKKLHKAKLNNFTLTKVDTMNNKLDFEKRLDSLIGKNKIDFAFIDADHSYMGVKNDFEVIYPRLSKTGIIAFHDTLMIDGCREFMLDLRTKYFDGTYDVVDLPFGKSDIRTQIGISLLVKRSFPLVDNSIFEICGSPSNPDQIEKNESKWLKEEIKKNKNHVPLNKNITIDDMDKALFSDNLTPTDRKRKFD